MRDLYFINDAIRQKNCSSFAFPTEEYTIAGKEYFDFLSNKPYKALVIDFDRTIHDRHRKTKVENQIRSFLNNMLENGIPIGIATGNGNTDPVNLTYI